MIKYLKSNSPKVTLILILTLFISNILCLFIDSIANNIVLYPSNLTEPWNWYRLLTYPLFVGGLSSWIFISIVIFFTGLIIERKLKRIEIIRLIFISSFVGGMIFTIINYGNEYCRPIASPIMILWGYFGATLVIGFKYWNSLNLFEKIIIHLCFLLILMIYNNNFGFLIGEISVIITIMIITIKGLLDNTNST